MQKQQVFGNCAEQPFSELFKEYFSKVLYENLKLTFISKASRRASIATLNFQYNLSLWMYISVQIFKARIKANFHMFQHSSHVRIYAEGKSCRF